MLSRVYARLGDWAMEADEFARAVDEYTAGLSLRKELVASGSLPAHDRCVLGGGRQQGSAGQQYCWGWQY